MKQKLQIYIFILSISLPFSYASAGTILSSYKYAWSNNTGYINFENVVVSDGALSGYAWSANAGWIKFDPAQGGVLNDGTGNLSGSAWGTNLGWIDFNGVSINGSTGEFSGTASGELAGVITFDCGYCDVRTDWRQEIAPVVTASGRSRGGSSVVLVSKHISENNRPLVLLPHQSGTLIQDTSTGKIILEIPKNTIQSKTTFTISNESLIESNNYLVLSGTKLVNSAFYNIFAKDASGNDIHLFSTPVSITLPLPVTMVNENNLAVYWFNETNWQWVLIPEAIFSDGKVKFSMSHLTKFAIFATEDLTAEMPASAISSLPLLLDRKSSLTSTTTNQGDFDQNQKNIDNNSELPHLIRGVNTNFVALITIFVLVLLLVSFDPYPKKWTHLWRYQCFLLYN